MAGECHFGGRRRKPLPPEQEQTTRLSFTLGARTWRALDVDWKNAIVRVEPSDDAASARWQGGPHLLGQQLCAAMREVLAPEGEDQAADPSWSQRARHRIKEIREEHTDVPGDGLHLQREPGGYRLWTFAGGQANNLLSKVMESELGEKITSSNLYLRFKGDAAKSEAGIHSTIDKLRGAGRPNGDDALRFAADCARTRLSKFEPCLPDRLTAAYMADVLTDPATAAASLGAHVSAEAK